jgi:hypothetical protein
MFVLSIWGDFARDLGADEKVPQINKIGINLIDRIETNGGIGGSRRSELRK